MDIVLRLQPAHLRTKLVNRQGRRIVDKQRRTGQRLDRRFEVLPLLGRQLSVAHVARVESRLADDQTHHQLLGAHFEREEGNPFFEIDRHVARQRQHESRLTHRRARRNDNQVGRLPAERQPVKVRKPGRHAAKPALAFRSLLDREQRFGQDIARLLHVALHVAFGHFENLAFGQVDQVGYVHRLVVRFLLYLGRRADQLALDELLGDDFAVKFDMRRRSHLLGQLREVGRTAHCGQFAGLLQFFGNGIQVDRFEFHRQLHDRLVDDLVRLFVKSFGSDDPLYFDHGVLFEHQGAEHGLFQFDGLRRNQPDRIGQRGRSLFIVRIRGVTFCHNSILNGHVKIQF